jgi:hypothetical protein
MVLSHMSIRRLSISIVVYVVVFIKNFNENTLTKPCIIITEQIHILLSRCCLAFLIGYGFTVWAFASQIITQNSKNV